MSYRAPVYLRLRVLVFIILGLTVQGAQAFKMEAGTINLPSTTGQSQLFSFSFQQTFDTTPIVVLLINTRGGNASAPRISNVTTTGFRAAQVEPFSEDGPHISMTVSYFAIEPGVHTLPDGTVIEAGTVTTAEQQYNGIPNGGKGWEAVSFANTFSNPLVIADVQTTNNEPGIRPDSPSRPFLTVAVNGLSGTGVNLALERSELYDRRAGPNYRFDPLSANEAIGYIVVEAANQSTFTATGNNSILMEGVRANNAVDGWNDGCNAVSYAGSYISSPIVLAQKISHRENDGGWLRECSRNSSSISLTIDEDTAQDNERSHVAEDVGLLIFSSAFVYDSNATLPSTSPFLMLEADSVSLSPSQFTSITFQQVYDYPPAVFVLPDSNNPEPTHIRIRNVTTTGFEVVPVEPPAFNDAADQPTQLHYLAVTYGSHTFPDGTSLQVSSVDISNYQTKLNSSGSSWLGVNFSSSFPGTPAVVAGIQTMNNESGHTPGSASSPWLSTAIDNVSATGMRLALERSEVNAGTISQSETVAYLAVMPGTISTFRDILGNNVDGEFLLTADVIRGWNTCNTASFAQSYPSAPLVVGTRNSRDGADGGWLRRCNITNSAVELVIDEDQTTDNERNHTTEEAGLAIFSQTFAADFSMIANYHLEGPVWNNSPNEVLDSSNNGLHGTTINDVNAEPGQVCYGARFDGTTEYTEVADDNALDIVEELTVMAWINPDTLPTGSNIMTIVSKDENFEFHLDSSGNIYWWWVNASGTPRSFTSGSGVSAGGWYHVAVVYSKSNARQSIYLNGTEVGFRTYSGEDLSVNADPLQFGGDQSFAGRYYDGMIDEVKIFKRALSAAAVQKYRDETRTCPAVLDHYGIVTNGTAVTCEGSPVTFTAYLADGTAVAPPAGTTLSITTTPNATGWSTDTASPPPGTFSAGANGAASYTFSGTETSVVLYMQQTTPTGGTPINTDVSDGTHSEDPAKDDTLSFVDTGFIFDGDPATAAIDPVATQTAGLAATLGVRAVRTDNDTGACVARLTGTQDVEFAYECEDPGTCKLSQGVTIAGTAIDGNANGSVSSYQPVSLTFNGSGEASFSYNYADAGQIQLHARKALGASGTDPAITLSGNTNSFVSVPAGFCIQATEANSSCATPYGNCSAFKKAGEVFSLSVSAVAWETSGETNSQFCSGNAVTQNFVLTGIPLELSLVAPGTGATGSLGVSSLSFSPADNGSLTIASQTISEVGAFRVNLNVDSVAYLGETLTDSLTDVIGRFYPDYFLITTPVTTPTFRDGTGSWSCGLTYQGQSFAYAVEPSLELTAYNAQDQVTQNYGGDFWKLAGGWAARTYSDQVGGTSAFTEDLSGGSVSYTGTGDLDGVGVATLNGDSFTYNKSNPLAAAGDAPFDADVNLELAVTDLTDTDGACYKLSAADTCRSFTFSNITGTEIRYGRVLMENAFGPETSPLIVPLRVERWNGSGFVVETGDDCTTYTSALVSSGGSFEFLSYSGNLASGDTTAEVGGSAGAGGTFVNGEYASGQEIQLTAPGVGNDGSTRVRHRVPDWLKYDWNNDGDLTDLEDNPGAEIRFGQYRGHDRIIFWREKSY